MKIKSQKDFWSGLLFLCIGAAFAIGSLDYSFGNSARPGPAYFPFGLGVLMVILGGMVLFGALTKETPDGDPVGAFAWRPLVIILVAVALFGFGFVISCCAVLHVPGCFVQQLRGCDGLLTGYRCQVFDPLLIFFGLRDSAVHLYSLWVNGNSVQGAAINILNRAASL